MPWLTKLFFSLFILIAISGCLHLKQELTIMLNQHNILQEMYIKNNTTVYDSYKNNKTAIASVLRAQQYTIVDIKENYARLAKSKNNSLTQDVWISLDHLEKEPTYFLKLKIDEEDITVLLDEKKYIYNMRIPAGKHIVTINSQKFLDQTINIEIFQDTTRKIDLIIDTVAKKIREEQQQKTAALEAKIKKVTQERKTSIYHDTQQNLMWQDDSTINHIQKPWITDENFRDKKYDNNEGDTAYSYCKTLNLAGFNDWRLPSKDELKILYTQNHSLKNISSNWYWSNSANDKIIDRAWAIYLNNGDGFSDQKNTKNFVRCVRVKKI